MIKLIKDVVNDKIVNQSKCLRCHGIMDNGVAQKQNWSSCRTCGDSISTEKGEVIYQRGNGVLCLAFKNGEMNILSFKSKPSAKQLEELKDILRDENIDTSKAYLTIMNEDNIELLFGKMPPFYTEPIIIKKEEDIVFQIKSS